MKAFFPVRVQYIFEGTYVIKAESQKEANELAKTQCGLVMGGGIHSSLPEEDIDWEFDTHPDIKIREVKDLNGIEIKIGDTVKVPEPTQKDDYWKNGFLGTVHCFKDDDNLICVEDQDENGWDVEADRVTVTD